MASVAGEVEENAAELKFGVEFLKARCLMNAEVAMILENRHEQLQMTTEDPSSQTSLVFDKTLLYVKQFSHFQNPDAVRQIRDMLCNYGVSEFELCVLGNICPRDSDEAKATVPSHQAEKRGFDDEKLTKITRDLYRIREFP